MSRKPAAFANHPVAFPAAPRYRAVCRYVVDGDTYDFEVDLGLYQYAYVSVRLRGIDTPELYRPADAVELARAQAARARVRELIADQPVVLVTAKDRESFGRFVADVIRVTPEGDEIDLGQQLVAEGHGVRWPS